MSRQNQLKRKRTPLQVAVSNRNWRKGRLEFAMKQLGQLCKEIQLTSFSPFEHSREELKRHLTLVIEQRYLVERETAITSKERESASKIESETA